jgi:oxygen-independent coproporphyrinogen-3 oxidase
MEFMMNALRLKQGFDSKLFEQNTGLPLAHIQKPLAEAEAKGLLLRKGSRHQPTELGYRFLNDLINLFSSLD